jgi:hypothetical protein
MLNAQLTEVANRRAPSPRQTRSREQQGKREGKKRRASSPTAPNTKIPPQGKHQPDRSSLGGVPNRAPPRWAIGSGDRAWRAGAPVRDGSSGGRLLDLEHHLSRRRRRRRELERYLRGCGARGRGTGPRATRWRQGSRGCQARACADLVGFSEEKQRGAGEGKGRGKNGVPDTRRRPRLSRLLGGRCGAVGRGSGRKDSEKEGRELETESWWVR